MPDLDSLLRVALDLSASVLVEERLERLLDALARRVPCAAACLMVADGGLLIPVAIRGLRPELVGRRLLPAEHPRLEVVCSSRAPVHFPSASPLPNLHDEWVLGKVSSCGPLVACLGCPLYVGAELIGALIFEAHEPDAFAALDPQLIATMAALAAATLRTAAMISTLERTIADKDLVAAELLHQVASGAGQAQLLGASEAMNRLRREIELVAQADSAVLIQGETGTGKKLIARTVHATSLRRDKALLTVHCAALPSALTARELFGHVRGAFPGATGDRIGKLSAADGGTLLLDEIAELPLALQGQLLSALQTGEFQRVGSSPVESADVRLIATTHRDLQKEVAAGFFRRDLYRYLSEQSLLAPPLRERRGDIALLSAHFCEEASRSLGLGLIRLTARARYVLDTASWPGNVSELESVVACSVLRAAAGLERGARVGVDLVHLQSEVSATGSAQARVGATRSGLPPEGFDLRAAVREYQKELIGGTVDACAGNWAAAARGLGMHRSNLHHLAKRLGMR